MNASPLIIAQLSDGSALIVLSNYQPAACCDGRLIAFMVNRDGRTHCVDCDAKLKEAVPQP